MEKLNKLDVALFNVQTAEEVFELVKQGANVNVCFACKDDDSFYGSSVPTPDELTQLIKDNFFVEENLCEDELLDEIRYPEIGSRFFGKGVTPAMAARNVSVAKAFYEAGADLNIHAFWDAYDEHDQFYRKCIGTALSYAKDEKIAQFYLDVGVDAKELRSSEVAQIRNANILKMVLRAGAPCPDLDEYPDENEKNYVFPVDECSDENEADHVYTDGRNNFSLEGIFVDEYGDTVVYAFSKEERDKIKALKEIVRKEKEKRIKQKRKEYNRIERLGNKISGAVIADEIANKMRNGVRRTVTPDVGREMRREILLDKFGRN